MVKASLGHVKDLPKKDLAVDVERGFEPTYVVIEGKKKLIHELKQAAKKSESVYLAADPDREGEAICYHLEEELEGKSGTARPGCYRVMFNEITAKAIHKAFEHPGEVDMHLVDAQQARRVLDRLVGYKISPLLWDKVRRGLSAGRVQTVALRLIVEREREIRAVREARVLDHRRSPGGEEAAGARGALLQARRRGHRDREPSRGRVADRAVGGRPVPGPVRWSRARSAATRCRRSSPPRCSRKPRANCGSASSAPWGWRSGSTKASSWARKARSA